MTRNVKNGTRQIHGKYINFLITCDDSYYWIDTRDGVILRVSYRKYDITIEQVDLIASAHWVNCSGDNHRKHIIEEKEIEVAALPTEIMDYMTINHGIINQNNGNGNN